MMWKPNSTAQTDAPQTNRLVMVLVLLLVFLMAARTPLDTDLWWHLRAGETTLKSGYPILTDTLSFTRYGDAWINHSWLSQVVLALIFRVGGYLGLSLTVALTAAASMAILYRQMAGPALFRAFIVLLATVVAAVVWSPRPQIFSLLFLAVCSLLLDDYRRYGKNRLWLLPPIFVLWSNLHGGYPLGLMVMGAYFAGEIVDSLFADAGQRQVHWRRLKTLLLLLVACSLAVAINPNGAAMWRIPFQTVGVGILQSAIPEWASPDFHDLVQQPFLWLLLLTVAGFALSGRRAAGADWISVVIFAASGLMARRNFGPFAMIAAPILSRHLWDAVDAFRQAHPGVFTSRTGSVSRRPAPAFLKKAINLTLVALIGFIAIVKLFVVSQPQFVRAYEANVFPVQAVEWLKAHPEPAAAPAGNLFNAYAWGGYLTWAYPELPVFVDGRTDLFGDEIISQWLTVVEGGEGWRDILNRWDINVVMVEPDRPATALLVENGWRQVYADSTAVILRRDVKNDR
ncbi:MAG: hypothetical protein GYA20_11580 [Chloroflexi bacterium]|nr:hypothetical protein [Chloroflexota bacterium]